MNVIIRTFLLLIALGIALYGLGFANHLMDESFLRKFHVQEFEKVYPKLDPCWTELRRVAFFAACSARDVDLISDIAFVFTSCFFEEHNVTAIQCQGLPTGSCYGSSSCARECAIKYSKKFYRTFNYSAFEIIHDGMDDLCQKLVPSSVGPEKLWKMRMPWQNIIMNLTGNDGEAGVTFKDPLENYHVLVQVLRDSLHQENRDSPFTLGVNLVPRRIMEQMVEELRAQLEVLKTVVEDEVKKRRHFQKSLDQARQDIDRLKRVVNGPKLQPLRTSTPILGSSKITPRQIASKDVSRPQTYIPTQSNSHSAVKVVKRAGRRSLNASYRRKQAGSSSALTPARTELLAEASQSPRRNRESEAEEENRQAKKPKLLQNAPVPQTSGVTVTETAPPLPMEPDNEEHSILLQNAGEADTGFSLKDGLDILRSTALEHMKIWNPTRQVLKDYKENLVNEMCSTEHIYHFTEKNAKSTAKSSSPWYGIVQKAFPPMSEDEAKLLVKYFTVTTRGESFFAQLVKLLIEKHQRHCNDCKASS